MKHFFQIHAASIFLASELLLAAPPEIRETITHQLTDRRVIVEHAPSIVLPDPPAPEVQPKLDAQSSARFAELAAEWRLQRVKHPVIQAGATVYRLPDGQTITHVTHWSVNNGPAVSFWSSADFSLLAHHGGFIHPSAEGDLNYSLHLFWTLHDVAKWQALVKKKNLKYNSPQIPNFPEGKASWILDKKESAHEPTEITMEAMIRLHEHYNRNFTALESAYIELENERAARCAELKKNPPQPRDIHLRVSRLSPDQASAWHQHAIRRQESFEQKEDAK